HRLISVELHAIGSSALSTGPKVGRVPEHFTEWDQCIDDLRSSPGFHALNLASTSVQIADNISHKILGHHDLYLHDRLKQYRIGFLTSVQEGHRTGDLKRHFIGVDVVERPVDHRDPDIANRVTSNHTRIKPLLHTLFDCRNEFFRDRATDRLIDKFQACA